MLVHEQPRQSEQQNIQEIPCQSTKCKSSKLPTHFTIPQETQTKKNALKVTASKMKVKKTAQEKQYRKLNKQSKKVKSLEQEYRELEEQIKEVKQMVQLQLQLINHTVSGDNLHDDDISNQQHSSSPQYSIQQVQQIQTKLHHNNTNTNVQQQKNTSQKRVNLQKLQQLITTLFSHQQTIQTANSNYLLLSQVNKQQQSQTLFQINSLQDRIRQLRFLLNGKEDLLAYELATMDNFYQNTDNIVQDDQDDNNKPICVDYHMPKKMTMANHHNMDSEYKLVQRAVVEMGRLRANVKSLEEQLRSIQMVEKDHNQQQQVKKNHGKENQEEQQYQQQNVEKAQRYIITPSQLTTRSPAQSAISKSNNNNNFNNNNNLLYLPLSTTNYKNSLLYKVAKLNSIQQQKGQQLKSTYRKLLKEYQSQAQRKKQLVSEYEIQRDIYQYKKRQWLLNNKNRNKLLLREISQQKDGCYSQGLQDEIDVENILGELQHTEDNNQEHKQKDACRKILANNTPSTIITVRSTSNQQPQTQLQQPSTTSNYQTVQSSPQNKNTTQQNTIHHQTGSLLFNQITNTPQKKQQSNKSNTNTKTNSNPFLKLKLKSTYQHQLQQQQQKTQIIPNRSNQNSPKNNANQQFTLSRFSQQKYNNNDKENPSTITAKKQAIMPQQKSNFNFNPSSFNTPTKRRGPSTIKSAQSNNIQKQFTTIKVEN